jgi:hypothetical protein
VATTTPTHQATGGSLGPGWGVFGGSGRAPPGCKCLSMDAERSERQRVEAERSSSRFVSIMEKLKWSRRDEGKWDLQDRAEDR